MTIGRRIGLVFIFASLALLGLRAVGYHITSQLVATSTWVAHTHEVLEELGALRSRMAEAESAGRGYFLTGDKRFVTEQAALAHHAVEGVGRIQILTADNPAQVARAVELKQHVEARLSELQSATANYRPGSAGPNVISKVTAGPEHNATIHEMESAELTLLNIRVAQAHDTYSQLQRMVFFGALWTVAALLLCGIYLTRSVTRPIAALRDATRAAAEGTYQPSISTHGVDELAQLSRSFSEMMAKRNHAEEELRKANAFLDSVIENLPSMVFLKESERLSFVRFNRAGELLLGVSRQDLLAKNDYDFFPAAEAEFFQKKDREALAGGEVVDIPEEPIQTPSGTRWLHTRKVPLKDGGADAKFLLGISEDITERKLSQDALRDAKEASERLNKELESFSYSVSHDLRSPLRSMDGFSQALLEDYGDKLDEQGKEYLHRVRAATQRMGHLIDDLLNLSRVSRAPLARETTPLSDLARQVVTTLAAEHPERRVEVKIQEGLKAQGDPRLLLVALENLLGNAWKFSAKTSDATIEFVARDEAEEKVFCIKDNGAGFDMSRAKKLFGAFQRLHSDHDFEGTGVGLATVQRIIERHGGRIWAEAKKGEGAVFYFTLPTDKHGARA